MNDSFLNSKEIFEFLEPQIIQDIQKENFAQAEQEYQFTKDVNHSTYEPYYYTGSKLPEVASDIYDKFLDQGDYTKTHEIREQLFKFGLAVTIDNTISNKIGSWLNEQNDDSLNKFLDNYPIEKEEKQKLIEYDIIKEAMGNRIAGYLEQGDVEGIENFAQKFGYYRASHLIEDLKINFYEKVEEVAIEFAKRGAIDSIGHLAEAFNYSFDKFDKNEKVIDAMKHGLITLINQNEFEKANLLTRSTPQWFLTNSKLVEDCVAKKFSDLLNNQEFEKLKQLEIADLFYHNYSDQYKREEIIASHLVSWAENKNETALQNFFSNCDISLYNKSYMLENSEQGKRFFEIKAIEYLNNGDIGKLKSLFRVFLNEYYSNFENFVKNCSQDDNIKNAATTGIIKKLKSEGRDFYENTNGGYFEFSNFMGIMGDDYEALGQNPEARVLLQDIAMQELMSGDFKNFEMTISSFKLDNPLENPQLTLIEKENLQKESLVAMLQNGTLRDIKIGLDSLKDSKNILEPTEETRNNFKQACWRLLSTGDYNTTEDLDKILSTVFNPAEITNIKLEAETAQATKQRLLNILSDKNNIKIRNVLEAFDYCPISPDEEIHNSAKQVYLDLLSDARDTSKLDKLLLTFFNQTEVDDIKSNQETTQAVKQGLIQLINTYSISIDNINKFFEYLPIAIDSDIKDTIEQRIGLCMKEMPPKRKEVYDLVFFLIDHSSIDDTDEKNISQTIFGTEDRYDYFIRTRDIFDNEINPKVFDILIKEHSRLYNKNNEQLQTYIIITQEIENSPSQEMIRIKDQLIDQILESDDPQKTYNIIAGIFIQNNIPMVGKVQRIFDALHPPEVLKRKIGANSSPILYQSKDRLRHNIIFRDLLKIHIESGNRSLKKLLNLLKDGEPLIAKINAGDNLTSREQKKAGYIFKKLKTLSDVSARGQKIDSTDINGESLTEDYQELCTQLGIKKDQTISQRIVEMFARPLGYENVDEILLAMSEAKKSADNRGRQLAQHKFILEKGDIIKNINMQYINNILQNGSVAKEFVGAPSDSTPLDTDVELLGDNLEESFAENIASKIVHAKGFGEVIFVIKDRDQFQKTETKEKVKPDKNKYELFQTLSSNHFGIRTGFPCTQIDFMILRDDGKSKTEQLFYSIAQNGYYIPVVDEKGDLIFTPENYNEYRKAFAGVGEFEGEPLKFTSSKEESYYPEIQSISETKQSDQEKLNLLKTQIRSVLLEILNEFDIKLKPEYDDSILGAELWDIGSTGRNTNVIGDYDFDLTLRIDAKDVPKTDQIVSAIKSKLQPQEDGSHGLDKGGLYQIRAFKCVGLGEASPDIDMNIVKKSDLVYFASHDAIEAKLSWIKENIGEKAYQETIANIILAKNILKKNEVYKRLDHGSIGGIGVENWIIANNGNLKMALESFLESAYENDQLLPLETFKKKYKILDAGINVLRLFYDNYTNSLQEGAYKKIIEIAKEYCK